MPMTMDERLDHARAAIGAYFAAKGEYVPTSDGEYDDTDVSDLIADLLHLQKYLGLRDPERALATALMHFEAEQEENAEAADLIVASSHGILRVDADGYVRSRSLENHDIDGGSHLALIVRFDLPEWRRYWSHPQPDRLDILDLGYWYASVEASELTFAPPDARWRSDVAEQAFGRIRAPRQGQELSLEPDAESSKVQTQP